MAEHFSSALAMHDDQPRRHIDPPNLWLVVLASSVTLHLCVIVAMLLSMRLAAKVQKVTIPVELVDIATTASDQPQLARQLPTVPGNTPKTRPSPATATGQSQSSPTLASSTASLPASGQRSTPNNTQTSPNTAPLPVATSTRSAPLPSPSTPQPTTPPSGSGVNQGIQSLPSPAVAPTLSLPSPPPVQTPDPSDEVTARVPVSRNPPASAGVSTTVDIVGLGSGQDIPTVPPSVNQRTRNYRSGELGCVATPESSRFFGQAVRVLLTIDDKGSVVPEHTRIMDPPNLDYAQLVTCLLKTWEFLPAMNQLDGQQIPVWSNIVVTVTVTALE